MQAEGRGKVLDQFANGDNPEAHYTSTGPEIWRQTQAHQPFRQLHGHHRTIMGVSRYLKEQNPDVQIVGLQPMEGASIPASVAGPTNTCRRFSRPSGSTVSSTWPRKRPRTSCVAWLVRKAFSVASLPAARWRDVAPVPRSRERGDGRDHL
ncbi:hypothetical protein QNM99_22810 [Pseudomonas sp. PCH446]